MSVVMSGDSPAATSGSSVAIRHRGSLHEVIHRKGDEQSIEHRPQFEVRSFVSGLAAGTLQAVALNPWDRAMYLSILHRRPFLLRANFRSPYEGFQGAAAQKILAGGLWFPLEDAAHRMLEKSGASPRLAPIFSGTIAGLFMAVLMNPLNVTKYNSWGTEYKGRQVATALALWRHVGPLAFVRGLSPTLMRDIVWGSTYSGLRHEFSSVWGRRANEPGWAPMASNVAAALVATSLSAPFNYVRNISYGTVADTPMVYTHTALRLLWRDALKSPEGVFSTLQQRMCLGWGTLRVGVGMGLGSQMYGWCLRASGSLNDDNG